MPTSMRHELSGLGRYKPIIYAVIVHLLVILILIVSFRWQSKIESNAGKVIKAVMVDTIPKTKPTAKPVKPPQSKKPLPKQDKQLEKKKKAALAKRQATEKKRKQKEKRRLEALAEAKRQKQQQQALTEMLRDEEQQRQQTALAARAASLAGQYKELIRQKVSRNWIKPPGVTTGLQCVVRVRLVLSGEVIQATVVQSSGNTVFDRSVENAVYKSAPLPIPKEQDLFEFFREIEFKFIPDGS